MDQDLVKMRDTMREAADIIDELLELEEREKQGEPIDKKESEAIQGRFLMAMLTLSSIQ